MTKAAPWSIKGVDFDVREAAKDAARRAGVSLGEWMNRAIADRAAEIGASAQEFDADERLEAVAAQLSRLSRESRADETPRRRRGEVGRRADVRPFEHDDSDWMEPAPTAARASRGRPAPERRPGRAPAGELFMRGNAEEIRRRRPVRDSADAEALFEQAVAAFEAQASRVETGAARAMANVAQLIEASEEDRADGLAQVDARLSEIEQRLHRGDKEAMKPLRGMIASVHDRLGEIETRLTRKERPADDKSLRGALERLESRIEAMSRQSADGADESHLRRLDARVGAILARLDQPAPRAAAPREQGAAPALKEGIAGAIGQIAARQRDLETGARTQRPPSAQITTLLDERFDLLARKFDAAAKSGAPDKTHIDRLQNGIEALSGRIEAMRQDFAASGDHSRAALERFARELAARVDAALVAPHAASPDGLDGLRRDIALLSTEIAAAMPRADVAGLEKAMRDLSDRVDGARAAMARAAENRAEGPSSAQIAALTAQVAAMGRHLADATPRAAAAAVQEATREWAERLDAAREDMLRAAENRAEGPSSAQIAALTAQVAAMGSHLADATPRAAAAAVQEATREWAERLDAAREEMLRAAAARPEPTSSAEFDALGEKVAAMSRALDGLAPRSQVASLEEAVRALTGRIERSREEGMREAVLAPIETIASDVRRALAEAGASANFEGVSRQLREVEDKLENLRHAGGDRADFLQVHDQTEQIRAMLAQAMDKIAPIERLERQIGALSERLEEVAHQNRDASAAQVALPWSEIEARLNDLALRIDRAGLDRAPAPAAVDDSRFDDLVRRLDYLHDTLAAQIEDARGAMQDNEPGQALEPLLRSLSEKLSAQPAPQFDSAAMEALDRRIAEISRRLEQGDSEAEGRLHRAIEELTARLETLRDSGREDSNSREISDLREKTEASDRLAQQTLSAVHETLEKVVDRLAMLEEDVSESRGAEFALSTARAPSEAARAPAKAAQAPAKAAMDAENFLMEPGAGRPRDARAVASAPPRQPVAEEDESDLDLDEPRFAKAPEAKAAPANYIDIARRALAARIAAESAEKQEKAETRRPAPSEAAPETNARAFVRPLAAGEKGASRRLPALLAMAVSVLSLGAYEAYRLFDAPPPPMQAVLTPAPSAGAAPTASRDSAPAPVLSAAKPVAPAPAAPAAAGASPTAPLGGAPILPGNVMTPKPMNGAGLPDPLATGSIGGAPNTIAAIQSGARALALKDRADKGDMTAQYDYAARLASGHGVEQDQAAAIRWFEKAAAQGMAQAQYRLGAAYEKGIGTPRDAKQAAASYQKAANQGHVRAMHNLGVVLAEGVDGKPDYAAAAQWFRRAAEYGVLDSQFNLAILYARGLGVPQDLGQSYVWFAIAAKQGDASAAKKRDEVAERLNAVLLKQAQKQAAAFHAKTPAPAVNDQPAAAPGAAASASL
ncbi:hypothetical protein [Rhodoblastus sp.]|uniref:hypothetical protein n=1 Tax=Rhodoblastus sp. TaxID=1962975 RepID=UPI003F9E8A0D